MRRGWTLRGICLTVGLIVAAIVLHGPNHAPLARVFNVPPPVISGVHGFSGNIGSPPAYGEWNGSETTETSIGYSNSWPGRHVHRTLIVQRECVAKSCRPVLWLELKGEPSESAPLVKESDGWHATFPIRMFTCQQRPDGTWIRWPQHSYMVFRFANGGRVIEARLRDYSWAAGCGYGTSESAWKGTEIAGGT